MRLVKFRKSQKQFFMNLHCPKNFQPDLSVQAQIKRLHRVSVVHKYDQTFKFGDDNDGIEDDRGENETTEIWILYKVT